jgi:hypothetical protein
MTLIPLPRNQGDGAVVEGQATRKLWEGGGGENGVMLRGMPHGK